MLSHLLVIGGTGMLSGAVTALLKDYDIVSVISRSEEGFNALKNNAGANSKKLNWVNLDYTDYQELTARLISTVAELGEITIVISWIHSTAALAPVLIAKIVNHQRKKCDYYDILGSEGESRAGSFTPFENITYHSIKLGHINEGEANRWLSNDEISMGVIEAVKGKHKEFTIGTI